MAKRVTQLDELPEIQALTDAQFRIYITLLFHTDPLGNVQLDLATIAQESHQSEQVISETLPIFCSSHLLIQQDATHYSVPSWIQQQEAK